MGGGERGRVLPLGQRGVVRYLLQDAEVDDADVRRPEPSRQRGHERRGDVLALPRAVELRLAQDRGELDPLPAVALLHDGLRPPDFSWLAAVPRVDGGGVEHERLGLRVPAVPGRNCGRGGRVRRGGRRVRWLNGLNSPQAAWRLHGLARCITWDRRRPASWRPAGVRELEKKKKKKKKSTLVDTTA